MRKSARKFLTSDSDWKKQSLTYTRKEGAVEVALSGFYQDVQTDILIRISPAGEMNVSYVVAGQPNGYLRETGLSFYLPERLDYLQWERKGMWSCYPEALLPETRARLPFITRSKCDMARTLLNPGRPIRTTITIGRMPVQTVTVR